MDDKSVKTKRLESLDALRGFDMLWIIGGEVVVRNLANATQWGFFKALSLQTDHMVWEGFHFYDLIMPLFLFMVGMSIPFSYHKRLSMGDSPARIYRHSLKRAIILFVLGMVCQCNLLAFDPDNMFIIHDTLQAIAIGYFFSILIYSKMNFKGQLLLTVSLVVAYWVIMEFVPVPGYPAGTCTHQVNPARYIDRVVFGSFDDPAADYTWILSSLGFIATVMSGVFATTLIRSERFKVRFIRSANGLVHKAVGLALIGMSLVVAGQILGLRYPIIKRLWSASFILHSSGLSFLLVALFYYVIDVKGYKRWAFGFKVIGMNCIAVYIAVHLIGFQDIAHNVLFGLAQFAGSYYPVLLSIGSLAIIYSILLWMYRNKTFIKI